VNWDKVFSNTRKVEIALNTLNYLIGKENFDQEFILLIKEQPSLIDVIPLLAVRDGNNSKEFEILVNYKNNRFEYKKYHFLKTNASDEDLQFYLEFIDKSGIKNIFVNKKVKNLVDYILGVEAGLDSNGRKNRSGAAMESIVEHFIIDFCNQHGFTYLKQATAEKILLQWDVIVPVDKSSRRYDFAVNTGKEILIFETNYYGGGGSKLKSTAGEYKGLHSILSNAGFKFIWITDGLGWNTASRPLRETFDNNDFVINLNMLENGILNAIKTEILG
jgi:type II restriction enzyme